MMPVRCNLQRKGIICNFSRCFGEETLNVSSLRYLEKLRKGLNSYVSRILFVTGLYLESCMSPIMAVLLTTMKSCNCH